MAEYIDKADLVKRLESRVKDYGRDCNSNAPIISRTYQAVLHMVEHLPTADVVPVVRCKDCKYYYRADKDTCLCTHKKNLTFKTALTISREHYCSYGKRRCEERETGNKLSMD